MKLISFGHAPIAGEARYVGFADGGGVVVSTRTYLGEEANLRVLAEEIADDPLLGRTCRAIVVRPGVRAGHTLRHGTLAEIAITVTSGVMTTTISDALRRVLERARDRGDVEEKRPSEAVATEPEQ